MHGTEVDGDEGWGLGDGVCATEKGMRGPRRASWAPRCGVGSVVYGTRRG